MDAYAPINLAQAIPPAPARWAFGLFAKALRAYGRLVGRRLWRPRRDGARAKSDLAMLRDNYERFRWFETTSRDLYFELGADARYGYVSPNTLAITGYAPEELLGKSIFDFIYPDDHATAAKFWVSAIADSRPVEFSGRYLHKDGSCRWFEGYQQAYRKSPIDYRVITIARDVTDRRAAEESARQSEARLLLHVEQTPVAVIGWDADGRIASWNPAAESIFGFTRDEAVGRQGASLLIAGAAQAVHKNVTPVAGGETRSRRATRENVKKDGRRIICEWHDTPLVAGDGSIVGVTSIVQDVTERVRAQEALRDSEAAIRSL